MATIILRDAGSITSPGSTAKGTPLTNLEVDNNFSNINVTLGILTNLATTAQSNLVVAINEIKNGNLRQFAATTSAQLAAVVSDETGSGLLVFATSPALVTPNIGTPSYAVLTSATGLPVATGISGLGSGIATFLATPSSANLATAVTDETGTGSLVFATTPTLVTPVIGLATGTSAMLTANIGAAAGNVSGNFTAGNFQSTGNVNTASALLTGTLTSPTIVSTTSLTTKKIVETVVAIGNTGTSASIDLSAGTVFTATLNGNATLTITNPGAASSFVLILTNDATPSRTVTFAGGTIKFPGGAASISRTTTALAVDVWAFFTPDSGTTFFGNTVMKNLTT